MIDIDLSQSGERLSGIDCYQELYNEFPNETYIIYTSQDIEPVRREINRLMYRDVELVLLDQVLRQENIRFYLQRLVRERDRNKVFVVHGRNSEKTNKLKTFLGAKGLGLEVISWNDAKDQVRAPRKTVFDIVLSGIEMSTCTVVLFTDDEDVELRKEFRQQEDFESSSHYPTLKRRQARPNVYIEAGYAFGKRPNKTIFIEWPDRREHFERPSDLGGYHVVRFSDTSESREELKGVLESARCLLKPSLKWKTVKL